MAAMLAVDAAAPPMSAAPSQLEKKGSAFAVQLEKKGPSNRRRLSATGMMEVADCENVEYTGVIGLGTPVQEFRVLLSVASSDLWVSTAAEKCCVGKGRGGGTTAVVLPFVVCRTRTHTCQLQLSECV